MGDIPPKEETIQQLLNQLSIARNEIKNLRQQVNGLKHTLKSDIEEIQNLMKNVNNGEAIEKPGNSSCDCEFPEFKSIGTIETWFVEKRGIPRQAGVCTDSKGVLTLSPSVINNPSYALDGLKEFSHLWIIYHFHKTDSNHVRTKVAPPRLNGARVGVFSTRSPHRPCPIGLSLVKIDKIVENKIHFFGVDMLNGSPVLDIKPYIPQYDNPSFIQQREEEREVEGGLSDDETPQVVPVPREEAAAVEGREAPDGEEAVKIAPWITKATSKLKVEFSSKALSQLDEISKSDLLKNTIISVLEEDPRSVYLRQKLGNQFYTFLIQDNHVSCKFDDANYIVTVFQIQPGKQTCECGLPEWQCTIHSQSSS